MPTTIHIRGKAITLSEDQDEALDVIFAELLRAREACLAGAAGTGKSTIMRAAIERWLQSSPYRSVILLAPTGKTGNRLREQTGMDVRTIHSAIFGTHEEVESETPAPGNQDRTKRRRNELKFGDPRPPDGCDGDTLVLVDEAGMLNEELAEILRAQVFSAHGTLLFVEDHEQIGPVEGKCGVPPERITARLTKVHRQALESPVLELATCIREGRASQFTRWGDLGNNAVNRIENATLEQAVAWAEEGREATSLLAFMPLEERAEIKNVNRVLLTWTNAVRIRVNRLTREARGFPKADVQVGETILCKFNNHSSGVMNGESFDVAKVEPCPELSKLLDVTVQWVTEAHELPPYRPRKFLVLPQAFDAYHPQFSDRALYQEAWRPLWAKKKPDVIPDKKPAESQDELLARMGWTWLDLSHWRQEMQQRAIQATWGYCLTVHAAQGSEWSEVGFISCPGFRQKQEDGGRLSAEERRRITYTVVSRAESGFNAFVLNRVPNYSRKDPYSF